MAAGDELAVQVAGEIADHLGTAAANVATMLGLDAVIVGGGVTEALGESFVERIAARFHRDVFPQDPDGVAVRITELREKQVI